MSYLKPQPQRPTFPYYQYVHNVPHSHNVAISSVPHSHSMILSMLSVSYSRIIDIFMVSQFSYHYYPHDFPYSHDIKISKMSHLPKASICPWCHTFSQHQYSGHVPNSVTINMFSVSHILTLSGFLMLSMMSLFPSGPRNILLRWKSLFLQAPSYKIDVFKGSYILKSFLYQKLW